MSPVTLEQVREAEVALDKANGERLRCETNYRIMLDAFLKQQTIVQGVAMRTEPQAQVLPQVQPQSAAKPTPPTPPVPVVTAQPIAPPAPPVALAGAEGPDCMGYYSATEPECQQCGESRKCQITTAAKAQGGTTAQPTAQQPQPQMQQPEGGYPITAMNALPNSEEMAQLQGIDAQNMMFILNYARSDKKPIAVIKKMFNV